MLPMKTTPIKVQNKYTKYFRLVFTTVITQYAKKTTIITQYTQILLLWHNMLKYYYHHTICSNTTIITHDQGA